MTVLVSNKAQTVILDPAIKRSFQQIERATVQKWNPMVLAAGWANNGGVFQTCEWRRDFSGFIHLRGLTRLTGSILNASTSVVATTTIASTAPVAQEIFIVWGGNNATLRLDILANGTYQVTNNTGGTLTNPYCSFSGITYDTTL